MVTPRTKHGTIEEKLSMKSLLAHHVSEPILKVGWYLHSNGMWLGVSLRTFTNNTHI
jgi:hypothetical protein